MTTPNSAVTTRNDGQFPEETVETAISLGLAMPPPSSAQKRLAKLVGVAWVALVALFFLNETALTFTLPVTMLVGAFAGAIYPRSSLRATLGLVLGTLLLCFVESKGTISYLVMLVVISLPLLVPPLWIGAWASAVAVRHLRTRHLLRHEAGR